MVVAGCGGGGVRGFRVSGRSLTIYAGLPMHGASRSSSVAIIRAARLALAQIGGRIGKYAITFVVLADSTAKAGRWDPGQTSTEAHLAAADVTTIGYIGDFDNGASAVSIPILNRAGIPQISPSNTAVGLTTRAAGASPGEPEKYIPTGSRTYVRLLADSRVQAAVQVAAQRVAGCRKTEVLADPEAFDDGLTRNFELAAPSSGVAVAGVADSSPRAADYGALASSVAQSGADCVLISADVEDHAVQVTEAVAGALPSAKIFGVDGLARSAYADPGQGGIPLALDARILITAATVRPSDRTRVADAFFSSYRSRYGEPALYAVDGYEAMSLLLDAIRRATRDGRVTADRAKVVAAMYATRHRVSVLGDYSIDKAGETTLRDWGEYGLVRGRLVFLRTIAGR
jgi:branched-chain amino acid transport system substrate-binding protein